MIKADIASKAKKRKLVLQEVQGVAFSIAPVLRFLLFGFVPLLVGLAMAFFNMEYTYDIKPDAFIGFNNFKAVLTDSMFYNSISNTFILAISWPISLAFALLIAVLLTKNIKGKSFYRTIYFVPFVCSVVAVTLMWQVLLDANYGVVNDIINAIFKTKINFKGDPAWFQVGLIIMIIWSSTGYKIVILTAALTSVDKTYYEAAEIDGANAWKRFRHITIPAISPTIFFLLITGLINTLQEFTRSRIWSTTGGPNGKGLTIVFYLYREAFSYINMGTASAVAWLLSLMIALITALNFIMSKKWVHYD